MWKSHGENSENDDHRHDIGFEICRDLGAKPSTDEMTSQSTKKTHWGYVNNDGKKRMLITIRITIYNFAIISNRLIRIIDNKYFSCKLTIILLLLLL